MSGFLFHARRLHWRLAGGSLWVGILALAFGIGTSAAAFDLLNAMLLRPLPVTEPDRLVGLYTTDENRQGFGPSSYPAYRDFRRGARSLEDLAAYTHRAFVMAHPRGTDRLWGGVVSPNYFAVLGVQAERGRLFVPEDAEPGSPAGVVLSHDLWQTRFGGEPGVLGAEVRLNEDLVATVAGVAEPGFEGTVLEYALDFWIPIQMDMEVLGKRDVRWLDVLIGRLAEGVTLRQAEAELRSIASGMAESYPAAHGESDVNVAPLRLIASSPARRRGFVLYGVLFLATLLVLLASVNNLTSLLAARAFSRRSDASISQALGASRLAAAQPFAVEGALIALLGCGGGIVFARLARSRIQALLPEWRAPLNVDLSADVRTTGYAACLVLLVALAVSAVPALIAVRKRFIAELEEGARSISGRRARWLRGAFVVSQVPVALVLLVVSGLMIRSLNEASRVEKGFHADDVSVLSLETGLQELSRERTARIHEQLLELAARAPGIEAAALAQGFPYGYNWGSARLWTPDGQAEAERVLVNAVSPDYFSTLDIPLLRGRGFRAADREGAAVVGVANSALVERFWPGGEAVGRQARLGGPDGEEVRIVGVVGSSRYRRLRLEPDPMLYLPHAQWPVENASLLVESELDSETVLRPLIEEAQRIAPEVPFYNARSLASFTGFFVWQQRMIGFFATILGAVTLVLGCLGLYGIIDFFTSRRSKEISVRMALGADRARIIRLVLWQGLGPVALGLGLGLLAAAAAARLLLQRLLFEVEPLDPVVFGGAAATLLVVAFFATWLPARRASRVQPRRGLQAE